MPAHRAFEAAALCARSPRRSPHLFLSPLPPPPKARTTTFDQHSPDVLFSKDVISFARKIGRYPADAPDSQFSFVAAYDPISFGALTPRQGCARRRCSTPLPNATRCWLQLPTPLPPLFAGGARFGEARVWNVLNPVCGGCLDSHLNFAQGELRRRTLKPTATPLEVALSKTDSAAHAMLALHSLAAPNQATTSRMTCPCLCARSTSSR